jgi:NodT family efflux transporter outer membrane factor (OMF) lipoprotein
VSWPAPHRAALLLFGVSLYGCALAPRYRPPTVAAPVAYGDVEWQSATPADSLPRGSWWERYHDRELNALESRLASGSPDLAAAVARYSAARALAAEANALLLPSVNAGALGANIRQSDTRPLRSASQPANYHDFAIGGTASYELDLWGRVRNLTTIGRASAQASAAELASIELSLRAELASEYLALRGIDLQLKLLTDTSATYQRAVNLVHARHDGGGASGLDVARAEAQLAGAHAQVTDLTARRALYEHAIARLIGETPPDFKISPQTMLPTIPAIPLGLPSTLVERRPDVAAAERRVAAANATIGVARAAFFPRVALNAGGGYESNASAGWLTAPNRYWAIGPTMALALFDAGSRRAEVQRATSNFDEAAARYRATVLSAFQEVADGLALVNDLSEELQQQSEAARAAERTLTLATTRYVEGAVSYLDVVVAQTSALQAEYGEISTQVRVLAASVGLIRGLGGGWTTDQLPTPHEVSTLNAPVARVQTGN